MADTHSWTRYSRSPRTKRASASMSSASSRTARERLCPSASSSASASVKGLVRAAAARLLHDVGELVGDPGLPRVDEVSYIPRPKTMWDPLVYACDCTDRVDKAAAASVCTRTWDRSVEKCLLPPGEPQWKRLLRAGRLSR